MMTNEMMVSGFLKKYDLGEETLIFPYGSRVYGTASEKSDHDFMVVVGGRPDLKTGEEYSHNKVNVTIYKHEDWQSQLKEHKIHTLEAYSLPDGVCKDRFYFELSLPKLRASISEKAQHSFVKAKKKILVEGQFYIGWKSLFHSLRILMFGKQVAEHGKIVDFGAANSHWNDIIGETHYEWDWYKAKYQPIFNQLATEFRKVAEK